MLIVRSKAFTLIELLLVIAIISILAAVGVMTYRQSFQTNRVDKVSIEMQHVLEAAMAFYVDNNAWPEAQPCDSSIQTNTFVTNYLPNGNAMSPLGHNYCWGQAGGSTNRLFWVAVQIPGNATDSLATATRIAAHLPNAVTTSAPDQPDIPAAACASDTCFVRAEITVPGASTNAVSSLSIAASGDCQTGKTIPNTGGGNCIDTSMAQLQTYQISFTSCPMGTQPVLTANPNFITYPQLDGGNSPAVSSAQSMGCTNSPGANQGNCKLNVVVQVCVGITGQCTTKNVTAAGASYIIVCEKTQN